jgi:hypothetical protein
MSEQVTGADHLESGAFHIALDEVSQPVLLEGLTEVGQEAHALIVARDEHGTHFFEVPVEPGCCALTQRHNPVTAAFPARTVSEPPRVSTS